MTEPVFTHFHSTQAELPEHYYQEMGRALYRWSQLESTAATLAVSIMELPWLDAIDRLRGGSGFKTKNIFQQLSAAVVKRSSDADALNAIDNARRLYEQRKVLFHSLWGHTTGPMSAAVAIQEWTASEYANFRPVTLGEIAEFATACRACSEQLMRTVLPHFHGAQAFMVDDDNGQTKRHST